MKLVPSNRVLMAWLLYGCVLFSTLACAIGHGQSSGLQLSGIQQLQCSIGGASDSRVPALSQSLSTFDCPLCASPALITHLSGYSLQLPAWQPAPHAAFAAASATPSRALWPAANPRAPPAL